MNPFRWLHNFGKGQYGAVIRVALLLWCIAAISLAVSVAEPAILNVAFAVALLGLNTISLLLVAIATRGMGRLAEISAATSLHAALVRKGWHPDAFFTDGAAATSTLCLLLVKCLEFSKPKRILEIGSGQSSKLLALYHADAPNVDVTTLEEDEKFAEFLREGLTHQGRVHNYCWAPLVPMQFNTATGVRVSTQWHDRGRAKIEGPYDLVLVDGPADVDSPFARSGVLTVIPEALAMRFVVIFDDADRYEVRRTVHLFEALLRRSGRSFTNFEVHGSKTHAVFCSNDYRFLRSA